MADRHAPDCSRKYDLETCKTCGHFPCWHRLDDSLNVSPTDPEANFRCLGEDFKGCDAGCPTFIGIIHVRRNVFDQDKD